jgi:hypothetical protein
MGRKKKEPRDETQSEESTSGDQLDLIDVAPENAKQIIAIAKKYKAIQAKRISALEAECSEKQNLLTLIKQANLKQVDGKIRFRVDGLIITVKPRDELVTVKEENEEENQE